MVSYYQISMPVVTSDSPHAFLLRVPPEAPLRQRIAVEKIGFYFKREFQYDFKPYEARDLRGEEMQIAFLFFGHRYEVVPPKQRAVGACGFGRERGTWELFWVWLHPFERRDGWLTRAWPKFVQEFGQFSVTTPLSEAMAAFLDKRGHPAYPGWRPCSLR